MTLPSTLHVTRRRSPVFHAIDLTCTAHPHQYASVAVYYLYGRCP
jgi:hypothetical protein